MGQASHLSLLTVINTRMARSATVILALVFLYFRLPNYFTDPPLWGEDVYFLLRSETVGIHSLIEPLNGYFVFAQSLFAWIAGYFGPANAPVMYFAISVALTLLVVWLITSPRLDMPAKPLLALAVVLVPMGHEVLGSITNTQWILPIGVVALLLMRPGNRLSLAGEALFTALTAFSGPFSIFLAPLFGWRWFRSEGNARVRLTVLGGILLTGAIAQAIIISDNPAIAHPLATTAYPASLWINLPLSKIMSTFSLGAYWPLNWLGFALGLAALLSAALLTFVQPYRLQKTVIFLFALAVTFAGMLKFRDSLESLFASERYFYAASVFAIWFLCMSRPRFRYWPFTLVVIAEAAMLFAVHNTPPIQTSGQWRVWAAYFDSGLPTITPAAPPGFYLNLPPSKNGPLSKFAAWYGKPIPQASLNPRACSGELSKITAAQPDVSMPGPLWFASGFAHDAEYRSVELILLADQNETVIGFGLPGFPRLEWRTYFHAGPGVIHAYGVVDDNLCRLEGDKIIPQETIQTTSGNFVFPVTLVPGNDIVQRIKPVSLFRGMSVRFVTFGRTPSADMISWTVRATTGGKTVALGSGEINPVGTFTNWGDVDLPLSVIPSQLPDEVEVSFHLASSKYPKAPMGIPLYLPSDQKSPAVIAGKPRDDGTQVLINLLL